MSLSSSSGTRIKSWNLATLDFIDVPGALSNSLSLSTPDLRKSTSLFVPNKQISSSHHNHRLRDKIDQILATCESLFVSNIKEMPQDFVKQLISPLPPSGFNYSDELSTKSRFTNGKNGSLKLYHKNCNPSVKPESNEDSIHHPITSIASSNITTQTNIIPCLYMSDAHKDRIKERKLLNRYKIIPSLKSFTFSSNPSNSIVELNDQKLYNNKVNYTGVNNNGTFFRGASKKCKKTSNKIFRVGSYRKKLNIQNNSIHHNHTPSLTNCNNISNDASSTAAKFNHLNQDHQNESERSSEYTINPHPNSNNKKSWMIKMNVLHEQEDEEIIDDVKNIQNEADNFHSFLPICCSVRLILCKTCGKSLFNKLALQCQNCLSSIHDIPACKGQLFKCPLNYNEFDTQDCINNNKFWNLKSLSFKNLSNCENNNLHTENHHKNRSNLRNINHATQNDAFNMDYILFNNPPKTNIAKTKSEGALQSCSLDSSYTYENSPKLKNSKVSRECNTTTHINLKTSKSIENLSSSLNREMLGNEIIQSNCSSTDINDTLKKYVEINNISNHNKYDIDPAQFISLGVDNVIKQKKTNTDTEMNLPIDRLETFPDDVPSSEHKTTPDDSQSHLTTIQDIVSEVDKYIDSNDSFTAIPVNQTIAGQPEPKFINNRNSETNNNFEVNKVYGNHSDLDRVGDIGDFATNIRSISNFPNIFDDPFLTYDSLNSDDSDNWTKIRGDKRMIKHMNSKDIKRQDIIHELIITERLHLQTLSIIIKIYSFAMKNILQIDDETLKTLFPHVSNLFDIHLSFYKHLKKRQDTAPIVENIGDVLLDQFSGEMANNMKREYGIFCSEHKSAIFAYKQLVKTDKNMPSFMQEALSHHLCRRKSVPECILAITQRITKYPIFLESIIKANKGKKQHAVSNIEDDDKVIKALDGLRCVLTHVDEQIARKELEQRLAEIVSKFDLKSFTILEGQKFTKHDLSPLKGENNNDQGGSTIMKRSDINSRRLLHEGGPFEIIYAGLNGITKGNKQSCQIHLMLMNDILVFLQENGGKYTFATSDNNNHNMPSVLSLKKLLFREKASEPSVFYIINTNSPEMYEIVCDNVKNKNQWMFHLRKALAQASIAQTIQNQNEDKRHSSQIQEDLRKMQIEYEKIQTLLADAKIKDKEIDVLVSQKNSAISKIIDHLQKYVITQELNNNGLPNNSSNASNFESKNSSSSLFQRKSLPPDFTLIGSFLDKFKRESEVSLFKSMTNYVSLNDNVSTVNTVTTTASISDRNLPGEDDIDCEVNYGIKNSGLVRLHDFVQASINQLCNVNQSYLIPSSSVNLNRSVSDVLEHNKPSYGLTESYKYINNCLENSHNLLNTINHNLSDLDDSSPIDNNNICNNSSLTQPKRAETFAGFDSKIVLNSGGNNILKTSNITIPDVDNKKNKDFDCNNLLPRVKSLKLANGESLISSSISSSSSISLRSPIDSATSSKTSLISSPVSSSSSCNINKMNKFPDNYMLDILLFHPSLSARNMNCENEIHRLKLIQTLTFMQNTINHEITNQTKLITENQDLKCKLNKYEMEKNDRKSYSWHSQPLEELRNIQESVSKERENIKKESESERAALSAERKTLTTQMEELKLMRERLKADQDLIEAQKMTIHQYWADIVNHRRSGSGNNNLLSDPCSVEQHNKLKSLSTTHNLQYYHSRSKSYEDNPHLIDLPSSLHGNCINILDDKLSHSHPFPSHLISATNERKIFFNTPHYPSSLENIDYQNCPSTSISSHLGSSYSFSFKRFQDWKDHHNNNNNATNISISHPPTSFLSNLSSIKQPSRGARSLAISSLAHQSVKFRDKKHQASSISTSGLFPNSHNIPFSQFTQNNSNNKIPPISASFSHNAIAASNKMNNNIYGASNVTAGGSFFQKSKTQIISSSTHRSSSNLLPVNNSNISKSGSNSSQILPMKLACTLDNSSSNISSDIIQVHNETPLYSKPLLMNKQYIKHPITSLFQNNVQALHASVSSLKQPNIFLNDKNEPLVNNHFKSKSNISSPISFSVNNNEKGENDPDLPSDGYSNSLLATSSHKYTQSIYYF